MLKSKVQVGVVLASCLALNAVTSESVDAKPKKPARTKRVKLGAKPVKLSLRRPAMDSSMTAFIVLNQCRATKTGKFRIFFGTTDEAHVLGSINFFESDQDMMSFSIPPALLAEAPVGAWAVHIVADDFNGMEAGAAVCKSVTTAAQ